MKRLFLAAAVAVALTAPFAEASIIGVTSRSALVSATTIDWSQLGPSGTSLSTPESWTAGAWSGEVGIEDAPGKVGDFARVDQGPYFTGNFAPNTPLLVNNGGYTGTGNIAILFGSAPAAGAGAQIQGNWYGPFTATISAYDIHHNYLGSFTEIGLSDSNHDGSAIFIGLLSTSADIGLVTFHVLDGNDQNDFGIGPVTFTAAPGEVPEPLSLALVAACLGTLAVFRRRRS